MPLHLVKDDDLARFINWWQEHRRQGNGVIVHDTNDGVEIVLIAGNRRHTGMGRNVIQAMKNIDNAVKNTPTFGRKPDAS